MTIAIDIQSLPQSNRTTGDRTRLGAPPTTLILAMLTLVIGAGAWNGIAAMKSQFATLEALVTQTASDAAKGAQALAVIHNNEQPPLIEHLHTAAESVFLIAAQSDNGDTTEIGTAWTVADGKLATNAHVAEAVLFALESPGVKVIARRTAAPSRDLVVTGAHMHPGYLRWDPILARELPVKSLRPGETINVPAVADVGLLDVDGDVGRPLPLASAEEFARLAPGDPIGYVGFPAEDVLGSRLLSPPATLVGRIVSVTSPFFQHGSFENATLIHVDLRVAGGASGSPILNAQGKVVGLVHAASSVTVLTAGAAFARISNGFNYAQRVDLLSELLDGIAESRQAARDAEWRRELNALTISPREFVERLTVEAVTMLKLQGQIAPDAEAKVVLEESRAMDPVEGGSLSFEIKLIAQTNYLLIACATDWSDINMELIVDGKVIAFDVAMDHFPVISHAVEQATRATIRIYSESGALLPDAEALLRVIAID